MSSPLVSSFEKQEEIEIFPTVSQRSFSTARASPLVLLRISSTARASPFILRCPPPSTFHRSPFSIRVSSFVVCRLPFVRRHRPPPSTVHRPPYTVRGKSFVRW